MISLATDSRCYVLYSEEKLIVREGMMNIAENNFMICLVIYHWIHIQGDKPFAIEMLLDAKHLDRYYYLQLPVSVQTCTYILKFCQ